MTRILDTPDVHGLDRLEAFGLADYARQHRATYPPLTRRPKLPNRPQLPSERVAARRRRVRSAYIVPSLLIWSVLLVAVFMIVWPVQS